ncbi:copper amine oxidase N-terminal domain-containing protein [Paenibacillus montanisoli]|nr:copper amine oxidase N-terminal domain-containing protein [Paenibacillus montanisoli]
MKNKVIAAAVTLSMLLPAGTSHVGAAKSSAKMLKSEMPIEVLYNARKIVFDVKPKMVDGTVLVPVRYVSEKLQATVTKQGSTILVVIGDKKIELTIGSKVADINGKIVTLPQPAIVENGRTLVPIRVISEGLGVSVRWDEVARFVWVGNEDVPKVEDVAELVDIKPFLPYYKGFEAFLDPYRTGKPATKAYVLNYSDFPVIINESIYYRWELVKDADGNQYIKSTTTQGGAMGTGLTFLSKGYKLRDRLERSRYRESINAFRIHYYSIVYGSDLDSIGDTNYSNFKIENVNYIGIKDTVGMNPAPILVDNPFQ